MLASRSAAEQNSEITGSRDDLEQWLGRPVSAFAYPFGRPRAEYTRATANLVRDAGFRCACSVSAHPISHRSRLHEIPRHAPPDIDGDRFERWLLERLRPPRGDPPHRVGRARARAAHLRPPGALSGARAAEPAE